MKRTPNYFFVLFLGLAILNSCVSGKKLSYFNNIVRDSVAPINLPDLANRIDKNDILQVNISSFDDVTTKIYGASAGNVTSTGSVMNGYLVGSKGTINLPLIGTIKAEGLTDDELADLIVSQLVSKKFAVDPVVTVKVLNYKVTILGEVNHPGVIPVLNERMTLPEALGLVGDLTPFGKRGTVLLIREKDGKRIFKRFSLNDSQLLDNEFFYLQNKDIIYVEPNNAKAALSDRTTQLLPIVLSALSLVVIIFSQIFKR
ncbi:polysaccharide export outer membrane protein [Mucilaginibacter gracilis]|uniref:Polysaccharide export outer membrane protein n=1 Tax=Mucilaginibacter gracilis TaxID=423350 RepID=A0A495J2J9_9SPHI|nr:polysaccharide biosynthesis/export family protein [Mucilaginibacter gracilis]RKR82239.1 polysaccharide export outer membrane protein [Mucilaginibacter gracilis]